MGSTANITGRCLARNLTGEDVVYGGCLGTGVVKLAGDLNAGRTGLTEAQAKEAGYDVITVTCVTDDKAHYYADASTFVTKLIADRNTHKLLGIQVLGAGAVDKMVDIAVTGIAMGAAVEDFDTLDFAYAPPFSTAIHPFVQACYILENKMAGAFETFTPAEYAMGKANGYRVIDAHPAAAIPGAKWIDLSKVTAPLDGIGTEEKLLLVCAKGKRGYFLQNRLKALGYTNTRVLEGGAFVNQVKAQFAGGALPPEEIKRVKALGCLRDKRYPDVFNVRVITRNGKITAAEHRTIAEASERFGSGAVTMTTRMTLEIQGVKHENIQPLIDFLGEHGLSTGGTGSLVRHVVSCKGTTCQYGLADTYGLSEKLHERFYVGYHNVTLPHKFKIAVGGCPNNCVKPDLNDLGIVGQSVPLADFSKCRGCKKCQVVENCPVKVAQVTDGKIHIDPDACNNCGKCVDACNFGCVTEEQVGYRIFVGGIWGKRQRLGTMVDEIYTKDQVFEMVERSLLLYREQGQTGERFGAFIQRIGAEEFIRQLKAGDVMTRKQEILDAPLHLEGGATC